MTAPFLATCFGVGYLHASFKGYLVGAPEPNRAESLSAIFSDLREFIPL